MKRAPAADVEFPVVGRVVGIDLGLECTGIAARSDVTAGWTSWAVHGRSLGSRRGQRPVVLRLHALATAIIDRVRESIAWRMYRSDTVVVIEGYAYTARGAGARSSGELGGAVRFHLFDVMSIVPIVVEPATARLIALGSTFQTVKGGGAKQRAATMARYLGAVGGEDEVDAWILARAGEILLEPDAYSLAKNQRRALDGLRTRNGLK